MRIEAKGFVTQSIDSITTEIDINLGDIPLA